MLQIKRSLFLLYYSFKKYVIRKRSPWDHFWNWYYRILSRHHNLRIVRRTNQEILVRFHRRGYEPLQCYLRIASSDPVPFEQVFIQGEYDPLIRLIEETEGLNSISHIIDAGGNIGTTTLYLKQHFPQARILTIEPDARNFAQIQKNVQVNELPGIRPIQAGVWKNDAYLSITQPGGLMNQTSLVVTESPTPTALKGVTIGALADAHDFRVIDVLKMDIEGTEAVLFRDPVFQQMLATRVRYLALEIHAHTGAAREIHQFFDEHHFTYTEASETTFAVNTRLTGL